MPNNRALFLIFFTIFLDVLGFGILVPVIPYLVKVFDNSALVIGLMTMSFSIAQFIASPFLGVLSDRFGRRPVLLFSILGGALAYLAFGLAQALWVFFAARIIDGLSGGNISTAQAYIADVSAPEDRAKNFGLIGAAFGAGFIIGPALGGVLSHISLQMPAYVGAGLSFLAFAFSYFMLPESLPPESRSQAPLRLRDINPFASLLRFIKLPRVALIFSALFILAFAMNVLRSNFMIYARDRFDYGPDKIGLFYAYLGVMIVLVQGVFVRRIAPRLGERLTAICGFSGMIIGFAWLALLPPVWAIYGTMFFIAFGNGLANPALTSLSSRSVGPMEQGALLGAQQSVGSVAMIIAPLTAGWMFDHISMGAPYALAAVLLLAGLGGAWFLCGRAAAPSVQAS